VADILTQVLGRKITCVPVEIEAFSEIWKEMGYTPYIRQHISVVAQDCRDGVFSGTNDLVEKLTGQKPMQMLDYIPSWEFRAGCRQTTLATVRLYAR
jgi:NAD(P)H dehydrogenase (quinone)